MNFNLLITVFVSFLLITFSKAQTSENSILWKIEHESLEKPSYLMGTCHLVCKDYQLPEKVMESFEKTQQLYLEVNITPENSQKALLEYIPTVEKISAAISKDEFDDLDSLLNKKLGMSLSTFDQYGLSLLSSAILQQLVICENISVESVLKEKALENNIPIEDLETIAFQLSMMNDLTDYESVYELLTELESFKNNFIEALAAYEDEDIESAMKLLNGDEEIPEKERKILLDNRNINWVKVMPAIMNEKSTFFAVGSGHLINENGLINLLRKEGFIVTPVF